MDGDVDWVKVRFLDIPHALHVDIQNADPVLGLDSLNSGFTERERRSLRLRGWIQSFRNRFSSTKMMVP